MSDDDTTKPAATNDGQDWSRFDVMTEAERHAAALADPDAQPLTDECFRHLTVTPRVKTIRRALGLSADEFSRRYGIPIQSIEDWEARRSQPDAIARAYLLVIARAPDAVRQAFQSETDAAA